MQARKERLHHCGLSNIDFKRLNETSKAKEFYDDMRLTNFGHMGRIDIPYAYESCGFGSPDAVKVHAGWKIPEPPNPRAQTAKTYYAKTKKPYVEPSEISKKKIKQLENPIWNENRVFTGEDVGRLTWYKKNVAPELDGQDELPGGKSPKNAGKPQAAGVKKGDKLEKHQKALQETQLVRVKNKETLEGKVDIDKVKEIRRAIRRRYGNRTNYHKIFNSWDRNKKGYIDISDLHNMINRMGISINVQEAQVLMASHDLSGNAKLTMDEFMDLIFSTNDNMNVDLSKLKFNSKGIEIEPNEDLITGIRSDAAKLRKIKDAKQLRFVLQKSLKELVKEFKEVDRNGNHEINFDDFKRIMETKVNLPEYMKEGTDVFKDFFNEFDDKKNGKANYVRIIENIKTFQYTGDSEINVDLGPETLPSHREGATLKPSEDKKPFLIKDIQKVPENQLQHIIDRTLRITRLLQTKYKSKEDLDKDMNEKIQPDSNGNVHAENLQKYFIDVCKNELDTRVISRKDLEGFLSSLVYNKYQMTNHKEIAPHVFSDNTQILKKIYSLQRPGPPPQEIATNFLKTVTKMQNLSETLPPVDNKRMRDLLSEIQDKTFADKKHLYHIFKDYDNDKDGYISYNDIKDQMKKLKVNLNDNELKQFIDYVDPLKKGFLDFNTFSTSITKTMADKLAPLPNTEENYLFRRTRQNLAPNREKLEENIKYHKTFLDKFNEIKNKFAPSKNEFISIFLSVHNF